MVTYLRLKFALAAFSSALGSILFAGSDSVVSTDWLAANLNSSDIRIIEVSVEPGLYERGHIPGAVNFRWHTDLVDPVVRDIVSPARFVQLLEAAGITPETRVIIYGDHNNWFAAWGVWIFHSYGHSNVALLDGGRDKWLRERRPVSNRAPRHARTSYTPGEPRSELRAFLADVVAVARGESDKSLVDIRSADEFNGRVFAPPGIQELAIRAGHVPGAANVPWNQAVNSADGTFLSAEALRELYASVGVDGSRPVIVYCRIGERSAHTWFVLSQILGYEVKQYDGSWTEYGNAVGVPINNPAGTVWGGK
jgi:thiosulfate/3-mercaptopyruvate sulfurtransferase